MKEPTEILPYDQHAQILLSHLEAIECGPVQMGQSGTARQEGEDFIASFVRFDGEPEDPERYGHIARRISDALVAIVASVPADQMGDDDKEYRNLKRQISDILLEELGPQKDRYYE